MVLQSLVSFLYNLFNKRFQQPVICLYDVVESEGGLVEPAAEGEFCCVCLSRLVEEHEDMRILPCRHKFHKSCVDVWFNACRKTCPLCRFPVGGGQKKTQMVEMMLTDEMMIYFSSFHVAEF
ncbi:hypothetical protein ACLB2K_005632 [Fragaria x ananassa]